MEGEKMSSNPLKYDAKTVKQYVTALQVAQDFGHVKMASCNQSNAAWRNGDNPTAILYNEDGTYHDYVLDSHGDAIQLYELITGVSFVEAVNALGDQYCPNERLSDNKKEQKQPARPITPATQETRLQPPPTMPQLAQLPQPKPAEEAPQPVAVAEKNAIETAPDGTWKPVNLPKNHYEELLAKGYKVIKEWPYTDAKGRIHYYVVRLENDKDKEILQRAADGTWGIKDEKRLLYNLPNIIESQKIYIVEGEKCADAMIEHGYVATTVSGGAGKGRWRAEFNDYFHNKDVVILTDCDAKGVDFGKLVCNEVIKVCKTLKIFSPCKGEKQDVADYFLLAEHTNADFDELEAKAPYYKMEDKFSSEFLKQGPLPGESAEDFLKKMSGFYPWFCGISSTQRRTAEHPKKPVLIDGMLRESHVMLLASTPKIGKSMMLIDLAISVANGLKWMDEFQCLESGNVLYYNFEIDENSMQDRISKLEEKRGILKTTSVKNEIITFDLRGEKSLFGSDVTNELRWDIIKNHAMVLSMVKHPKLIIFDPIYMMGVGDENSADDMTKLFQWLTVIGKISNAAVVIAHHFAKGNQSLKNAMDRTSGSGVFSRAPDAMISLTEIELKSKLNNGMTREEWEAKHEDETPFRADMTLREFPRRKPTFFTFKYPSVIPAPELEGSEVRGTNSGNEKKTKEERNAVIEKERRRKAESVCSILRDSGGVLSNQELIDKVTLIDAIPSDGMTTNCKNSQTAENWIALAVSFELIEERKPTEEEIEDYRKRGVIVKKMYVIRANDTD
jgi:5S rRNA maturation endonuclease (ribonuclease M5)